MVLDRSEIHIIATGTTPQITTFVEIPVVDTPISVAVGATAFGAALHQLSPEETSALIQNIAGRLYLAPSAALANDEFEAMAVRLLRVAGNAESQDARVRAIAAMLRATFGPPHGQLRAEG